MTERTLPIASGREVRSAVWRCVRPDKALAVTASAFLVVAASMSMAGTRLLGMVIDDVTAGRGSRINTIGLLLATSVVLAGACGLIGRQIFARVVERGLARLRQDTFKSAMRLRLDTIERVGTADPLSRLTGDIGNISDAAHDTVPLAIVISLSSVLALVALILTSPLVACSMLIGAPVCVLAVRRYVAVVGPMNLTWLAASMEVTRVGHEIGDGGRTIRTFGAEHSWRARADQVVDREWELEWPISVQRCILYPAVNAGQGVTLGATLIISMFAYRSGYITLGVASSCALYVVQCFQPVGMLLDLVEKLQIAQSAFGRVVGVTLVDQDRPGGSAARVAPADGRVELRDVHFSYEVGREVLRGVNLSVDSGERIAVVGVSGAGKSTIAKLLAAIHEPTSGQALVGGVPVPQLDQSGERRPVALITQESHVFLGSVADNCRLASPTATDDDLRAVFEAVHSWDWVSALPEGLNTRVGRNGKQLTLVQAQQLALARVLLMDPLVVILDEATAGLGGDMARGIERSFGAVLAGRTVITIAHRLDVAATADRVVVVDDGRLEVGTHEELLARGDSYAAMWKHWTALRC